MSLAEIITSIQKNGVSWLIITFIITSFVQISPIKINPWDKILGWLGRSFTKGVNDKLEQVNIEISNIKETIDEIQDKQREHILNDEEEKAKGKRDRIVSFANSIASNRPHTLEEFVTVLFTCDEYVNYCHEHPDFKNSIAEGSIKLIKEGYEAKLREGDANDKNK